MNSAEQNIWINIRAEHIKHFHDTRNGDKFTEKYPIDRAKILAKNQLEHDLEKGCLRITLEELLMLNNEDCHQLAEERTMNKIKELIQ